MRENLFDISEEIVIITGASGQLGLEYSKAFLHKEAKVIGLDLRGNDLIIELSEQYKDSFTFIKCDITDSESLKRAAVEIQDIYGCPTVLINNAAIDSPPEAPLEETGPFEDYPETSWDKVMNVNVKGVFLACKVFGSLMANNLRGSIINISSIYGVVAPDQSLYEYKRERGEVFFKPVAYAASKSALINLSRYLAVYWAKKRVRVNTLVIAGVFNGQEEGFLNAYCQRIPIGRMANHDEYNGALVFLASNASKYMTGSQMTIDGGWTAI
ncbi:SDR family oxidoreductase [Pedobacter sp. P351]|uniref:SDR family oxidoreductase n=1 Tax=Pedobacter superstes TaxID=3133441 RepID=UPI0030B6D69C